MGAISRNWLSIHAAPTAAIDNMVYGEKFTVDLNHTDGGKVTSAPLCMEIGAKNDWNGIFQNTALWLGTIGTGFSSSKNCSEDPGMQKLYSGTNNGVTATAYMDIKKTVWNTVFPPK